MESQEWMKDLTLELKNSLSKTKLKFHIEEKIDKTYATQEFFQKDRTVPFFVLMNTTNFKLDVIFMPTNDYQVYCDMQYIKMYSPEITIVKESDKFLVLFVNESKSRERMSENFEFKKIIEVAEFIFKFLQKHICNIKF